MMDGYLWLYDLALLLYSIGMAVCGFALVRGGGLIETAAWVLLPAAWFAHLASFVAQWYHLRAVPLVSLLGAFSLYALLSFLGALRFAVSCGSVAVAFSLGAIPYATLLLAFLLRFQGVQLKTELPPSFVSAHLVAVMASFAAFSLAAGSGALLLTQERALKEKRFGRFWESLPPLGLLDRETYRFVLAGFCLLTAGIGIGVIGAPHAWGGSWFRDSRLLSSLVVWGLYGCYLGARARYGWRGRKLALFSVSGFVLTLVVYVAVNMGKYLV